MKDQKKAKAIAAERMQLLSPLLADGIDPAKAKEIKVRICEQTGISERTLRRYLAKYREEGFSGLKPLGKGRQPSEETIPPEVLEQAILLRREVPGRSVAQLIQILEWEGRISAAKSSAARCKNVLPPAATVRAICSCTPNLASPPGVFSNGIVIVCGTRI